MLPSLTVKTGGNSKNLERQTILRAQLLECNMISSGGYSRSWHHQWCVTASQHKRWLLSVYQANLTIQPQAGGGNPQTCCGWSRSHNWTNWESKSPDQWVCWLFCLVSRWGDCNAQPALYTRYTSHLTSYFQRKYHTSNHWWTPSSNISIKPSMSNSLLTSLSQSDPRTSNVFHHSPSYRNYTRTPASPWTKGQHGMCNLWSTFGRRHILPATNTNLHSTAKTTNMTHVPELHSLEQGHPSVPDAPRWHLDQAAMTQQWLLGPGVQLHIKLLCSYNTRGVQTLPHLLCERLWL